MTKITIGHSDAGTVKLDLDSLIDSRAIIQASSGGGKSWLLRVLAEQIMPHVPVIILDREGEFATLREKFDLVIVGGNGEVPADVKSAGKLAHKLVELRTSAAINLYDLGHAKRPAYVKAFLDALIDVPKRYWQQTVIVIDEAHQFCPQDGSAESCEAVIKLQDLGRKRSFCGILATQRLSKLDKDAAAECKNKFIGWTDPIDQKRAADTLGIPTAERIAFSRFKDGEWWAFGPALGLRDVVKFVSAPVQTTHPKPGQVRNATAPQASKAILKFVPELQALATADDQPTTIEEAQKAVAKLRTELKQTQAQLTRAKENPVVASDQAAIDRAVANRDKEWKPVVAELERVIGDRNGRLTKIEGLAHLNGAATSTAKTPIASSNKLRTTTQPQPTKQLAAPVRKTSGKYNQNYSGDRLPIGESAILRALIQFPHGLDRSQLTVLTGYKRSSRDAYIARLAQKGFVNTSGDRIEAMATGIAALPDAEPLPTGDELQQYWFDRLPEGERKILERLVEHHPSFVTRDSLTNETEYKRSSRDAYIARLKAKQLVVTDSHGIRASDNLF